MFRKNNISYDNLKRNFIQSSIFSFSVCTKCTNPFPAGSRKYLFIYSLVIIYFIHLGITEFDGKQYHVCLDKMNFLKPKFSF